MKRIMILGASVLQLPAIKKAKEMGMYIGVIDYNPKAIGIPFADEFYEVSTIDEIGVCEACREFQADGIMTLATDMPMRSVAYTCEQLGLVGINYDTAVKATDKGEMIKAFKANDVEHPWFYILKSQDDIPKGVTFPCITKPTDNSGSRGVMLVRSMDELKKAIGYSSENGRSGSVIIEEYMEGSEVSVELMVIDGVAYVLQITDKLITGPPHFVEMGHNQPSRLPEDAKNKIADLASRAALAVGIKNGPARVEIIATENGPKMVEIGARMGGDNITTHLVPLSTGIDMVRATIELALGIRPEIEKRIEKGSAIRYFDVPIGIIESISNVEEAQKLEGVKEITFIKSIGEKTGEIGNSSDRIGFVIAQSNSADEAIEVAENALKKVQIEIF